MTEKSLGVKIWFRSLAYGDSMTLKNFSIWALAF